MNLLDVLLAAILCVSVAAGFVAGFARAGLSFFSAVLGLLFALWFYAIPAAWIHRYVGSATISNIAGFFVVLCVLVLAGSLLGMLFSKLFRWTGLSWLDRLLGGIFGAVRGGLIAVAFVAVMLAFTPKPLPNWMINSQLLPYAVDASNLFAAIAPNEVRDAFHQGLDEIRKEWNEQVRRNREKEKKQESDSKKNDAPKRLDF